MKDVILDTLIDFAKLLPFLFLTYLLMEWLEHKTSEKAENSIRKAGRFGPVIGGLLGVVPQCGFSASASGLYAGGIITTGTLAAIFLSTSDEMLPICISEQVEVKAIIRILATKVILGVAFGLLIDLVLRLTGKGESKKDIHCLCESDDCHCEEENIFKSALIHTVKIAVFILIITFALNVLIFFAGEETLGKLFVNIPVVSCLISALVGLIPNCAASVVITELFLSGVISDGALISGLLAGSGLGILVLFRLNKNIKQNVTITAVIYALSVAAGAVIELTGIRYLA